MTKQELMSLPHLAISEETNFIHIHTEKGFFITKKTQPNIRDYQGFECLYAPIKDEYPDYKIITEKKHIENEHLKEEATKKEMEEMEKKHKEEMLNGMK